MVYRYPYFRITTINLIYYFMGNNNNFNTTTNTTILLIKIKINLIN